MDVIHYQALAAARLVLHRRTLHRPVRAEDAADAGLEAQQHVTAGALIVELADIRRLPPPHSRTQPPAWAGLG